MQSAVIDAEVHHAFIDQLRLVLVCIDGCLQQRDFAPGMVGRTEIPAPR
jgi:hypothetical protein